MQFNLVPSLESRALTSISATLLNNHSNRAIFWEVVPAPNWHRRLVIRRIERGTDDADAFVRYLIHKNVEANVQILAIPELLKKKLTSYVDTASYEILQWLRFHVCRNELLKKIPETFLWTPHGTIDLQKTANILVSDNTIDIADRFRFACMYCFEDHIFTLWDQLDEETRKSMDYSLVGRSMRQKFALVNYWCHYIRAKRDTSIAYRGSAMSFVAGLYQSLEVGNAVAVQFFLLKITAEQKNDRLVDITTRLLDYSFQSIGKDSSCYQYTEIMCLILNSLDAEHQMTVLKKFPYMSLVLFLEWPWRDYFIKVHQCVGHLLSSDQFFYVLMHIKRKQYICKSYDYDKIVIQFWHHSCIEQRKDIYRFHSPLSIWLPDFYKLGNWHTFNLIAQDANKEQREKLLSSQELSEMVAELIAENNWDAIKFFVTKCLLSIDEIDAFRVRMNRFCNKPAVAKHFGTFNNLIDDASVANNKNKHVPNDGSESKRACLSKF